MHSGLQTACGFGWYQVQPWLQINRKNSMTESRKNSTMQSSTAQSDKATAEREPRWLPLLASFNAVLALTIGTFSVHGVTDPQAQRWIITGVVFQLPHVAAVFALLAWRNSRFMRAGAWAICLGSLVFAGNLYALATGAPRIIAAFAPIGGTLMMLGWLWIGIVAMAGDKLHMLEGKPSSD